MASPSSPATARSNGLENRVEPGMFMRNQALSQESWKRIAPLEKIKCLKINPLAIFDCRLSKGRKMIAKMKVYPGMLKKTKDRNCTVREYPGMYKKNKLLIRGNREYL
jgi:hypothetical protein